MVLRSVSLRRGIRARRFTIRDHDQVLMVVPFDRLPIAFPFTLLVCQAVTESVLVQRLGELWVRVRRPCEFQSLQQDGTGVTAIFAGGEPMRVRYLVVFRRMKWRCTPQGTTTRVRGQWPCVKVKGSTHARSVPCSSRSLPTTALAVGAN